MGQLISIAEARKLLNKQLNATLTDKQIQAIIQSLTSLSYYILNQKE